MAEELDDGEFWLPSHFLTDDDIVMDFDFLPLTTKPGQGESQSLSGFTSNSDLEFTSGYTETESDEEDILLTGSGRVTTCPVHSKGSVLSSSPQSTLCLCGCLCNQGSSRDSPSGPVSPPQPPPKVNEKEDNATLDLLNKAAGEVARLKMETNDGSNNKSNNNNNNNKKSSGTGFFDCSQKGILYPPPLRNPDHFPPLYFGPQFHHFPPMVWSPPVGVQYNQPQQQPQPQPQSQNRATKNNNNTTTNATKNSGNNGNNNNNNNNKSSNNNRPLGLPPSAWPPLPAQNQAQNMKPATPVFPGPKRECAGTGVFLPRRVTTPTDTRKKSDGNPNSAKTKSGKVSQSNNRKKATAAAATTTASANANDIQLPREWTY